MGRKTTPFKFQCDECGRLIVSQNRISMAKVGLRWHHVEGAISSRRLWTFNWNLTEAPGEHGPPFLITPGGILIADHNVFIKGLPIQEAYSTARIPAILKASMTDN